MTSDNLDQTLLGTKRTNLPSKDVSSPKQAWGFSRSTRTYTNSTMNGLIPGSNPSQRPMSLLIPSASSTSSNDQNQNNGGKRPRSWHIFSIKSQSQEADQKALSENQTADQDSMDENQQEVENEQPKSPLHKWVPNQHKERPAVASAAEMDAISPQSPGFTPLDSNKTVILKSLIDESEFSLPISAVLDSEKLRPQFYNGLSVGHVELAQPVLSQVVEFLMHHVRNVEVDDWDLDWCREKNDEDLKDLIDAFYDIGNSSGMTLLQREALRRMAAKPVHHPRGAEEWKRAWKEFEDAELRADEDAQQ
ncbi:hypothetical protein SmJEL517_g03619 [Synchytrium microbalum]|uniref:Uncharacterized protein n=1 Tax=Synchytrium microbalum TaxID=1806994 RepID=A0A507C5W2_9FUNG|nr:uncharacterized protein SmJEL517_g03619 [Synchytrium microbalum]TPX33464.1 hypothetical protein SmJEL517_g03619 [Synchytrium microbalum]